MSASSTERPAWVAHHFDTAGQQTSSAKLGMWLFLATELLMFSGLFLAYFLIRKLHPEMVLVASEELNKTAGGINTIVLITSSFTMALGVRAAQIGDQKALSRNLRGWSVGRTPQLPVRLPPVEPIRNAR